MKYIILLFIVSSCIQPTTTNQIKSLEKAIKFSSLNTYRNLDIIIKNASFDPKNEAYGKASNIANNIIEISHQFERKALNDSLISKDDFISKYNEYVSLIKKNIFINDELKRDFDPSIFDLETEELPLNFIKASARISFKICEAVLIQNLLDLTTSSCSWKFMQIKTSEKALTDSSYTFSLESKDLQELSKNSSLTVKLDTLSQNGKLIDADYVAKDNLSFADIKLNNLRKGNYTAKGKVTIRRESGTTFDLPYEHELIIK